MSAAVLALAMAIYACLALWITRGTTLFVDEVNIFTVDRGLRPSALLTPLNGHFVLFQRLIFALDFKLLGVDLLPLRLLEVAGVVLVVGLVYVIARRRIGNAAALAPALLLLFLGSVWELTFVVSGLGNVYAAAAGLGALLLLERHARRADLAACALLIVAVCTFTTGAAFAVGALVLIGLGDGGRRRLWVALVPILVYAAWLSWVRFHYVPAHGEVQSLRLGNVLLIPNFVADEAASVAGVIAGLNYDFQPTSLLPFFGTRSQYGPVLAALAVGALVWRLRRERPSPFLWALLAAVLAFWSALAMGFGTGRDPDTVRYAYAGAILVLLVAAEAARGVRLAPAGLLALFAITLCALGANLARLRDASRYYRTFSGSLRAELTAIDIVRDRVSPTFSRSSATSGLAVVPTGPYLAAVERIGSPAYSEAELLRRPEAERNATDNVLVQALRIRVGPAVRRRGRGRCLSVPRSTSAPLRFRVPIGGMQLKASAPGRVALRRFAVAATVPVGVLQARQATAVQIPADRSPRPWQATVSPGGGRLRICTLS